ncbi:hypothetical protein PC117_g13523 [Phytophthora cactorum]|uniref:Uncharacterized protein n=1 Tax=Phytophthora cactorum TaxID=29920 RepID=A0A8T1CYE3_9STRA|nr:hypothetical protein PC117_g13523 [Phytophthora cactorum]
MLHVRENPPSAGALPSAQPAQGSVEPSLWLVAGKRRLPVGAGRPTGEELSSVGPPGGRGQQDPAPRRAGLSYEKIVCKPGLLVVQANVKGFEKPWRVLIDSGASGNYPRRSILEGSQQYAEALEVQTRDTILVRLATGILVTVSKVSVDLVACRLELPLRGRTAPRPCRRYDEYSTPNPFAERYNPVQSRQLSTEPSSQRSNRPVAQPLTLPSRRKYGFQPLDPAETARRAALEILDSYVCGPSAATADQQVRRYTLRERFLTQKVITPREYRERLRQQLHGQPVPAMGTIPVVIRPGKATTAYEAQFQNWVERARWLPSYEALRASFSETDIHLERRLRLDFAKLKARCQLPGPRPQHHEAPPPPAPAARTAARVHEPAAPATGQSMGSAADLSSPRSSGGKRSQPGDAAARHGGALATDVPGHKRQRRLSNPAGGEPQTPMSFVNEGNLGTSQDIGYDPGDDAAAHGVPRDSGAQHARRAEPVEDEPRLDPRAASHHDMIVLYQRVRSLSSFVHDANASHARLAEDLEEMHRRVDRFETRVPFRTVPSTLSVKLLSCMVSSICCCAFSRTPRVLWLRHSLSTRPQRLHAHLSRVLVRLE